MIKNYINTDNSIQILRTSNHYGAAWLKDLCLEYICKNYDAIKFTSSFQDLLNEPELMLELLIRIK
jgi:hypothetical protein